MAYVHLKSDIAQINVISASANTHNLWRVYNNWATFSSSNVKKYHPCLLLFQEVMLAMTGSIIQGLLTSALACAYRQSDINNDQWRVHIGRAKSTCCLDCPHQLWPMHINQRSSAFDFPHRPCLAHNGQSALERWVALISCSLHIFL